LEKYSGKSSLGRPGHGSLGRAVELVRGVASSLDESLARFQNQAKVSELQASLSPPPNPSLVASHREFVLSGDLEKVCKFGRRKRYYCALLSDLFLYASPISTTTGRQSYKLHHLFSLVDIDAEVEGDALTFVVYGREKSSIFQASSVPEKGNWVAAITHCVRVQEQARASKGLVPFSVVRDAAPLLHGVSRTKRDSVKDQLASCHVCKKKMQPKDKHGTCRICKHGVCSSEACSVSGPFTPAILQCFDQIQREEAQRGSSQSQDVKHLSKKESKSLPESTTVCRSCFSSAKERARRSRATDQTMIGGIFLDELLSQHSTEEAGTAPAVETSFPPPNLPNPSNVHLSIPIPGGPIWEPPDEDNNEDTKSDPFGMLLEAPSK
jgi:hypothetical protein